MYARYLSFKEVEKLHDAIVNNKFQCKCGHKVFIPNEKKKALCNWCGHYVYRDKQLEFKEKLKKELKK